MTELGRVSSNTVSLLSTVKDTLLSAWAVLLKNAGKLNNIENKNNSNNDIIDNIINLPELFLGLVLCLQRIAPEDLLFDAD